MFEITIQFVRQTLDEKFLRLSLKSFWKKQAGVSVSLKQLLNSNPASANYQN